MKTQMFCFQCQETAKNTGCTIAGVCGKKAQTAAAMDMLLFVTRGISVISTTLRDKHIPFSDKVDEFVLDALFTTITNANFDTSEIMTKIQHGFDLRDNLVKIAKKNSIEIPDVEAVYWHGPISSYTQKASEVGVLRTENEDIRSLKELITYGLKGMAAYLSHARNLGFRDANLDAYIQRTLSDICTKQLSFDDLFSIVLQTGEMGVKAMALLDTANTSSFGNPETSKVNLGVGKRPGILVSGHDYHDLEMLLEQSINTGVDIYTHGEMLPAHYYPLFKKYPHLVGNYGGSWWHQKDEFARFNGPILFTTNCIVPPVDGSVYKERMFTTNSSGYPGCRHIECGENGKKDFSEIIAIARHCGSPQEIESGHIIGGFAHNQVEQIADKIVDAVKSGKIRKFVVMAGCDGRMPSRNYYSEFARRLPNDCVILTAGCAKYRYIKMPLGNINGIPRVLDAGQCNDSYSLVLTAILLRDAFKLQDINQLPVIYNIAWYEQKAVIVLLALLSLGLKNIHIGPTLPAFLSPKVVQILSEKCSLNSITTVDEDIDNFNI
ncbi:MAG: hydroxylamine reductase [Bacteroidales bacterium]|nr:hydroxylamine reductase [Bacteroidales bacterium]